MQGYLELMLIIWIYAFINKTHIEPKMWILRKRGCEDDAST
jgi:hypothetical protein